MDSICKMYVCTQAGDFLSTFVEETELSLLLCQKSGSTFVCLLWNLCLRPSPPLLILEISAYCLIAPPSQKATKQGAAVLPMFCFVFKAPFIILGPFAILCELRVTFSLSAESFGRLLFGWHWVSASVWVNEGQGGSWGS